jgi:hypothetical protein
MLEKKLLHLACRHHVLELIAKATFIELFGETTSPDTPQFNNFQNAWATINKSAFNKLEDNRLKRPNVKIMIQDNLKFLQELLSNKNNFLRDDYRELAELCFLILGGKLPRKHSFKSCGVTHHARWMNKVIYTFKIYLFR